MNKDIEITELKAELKSKYNISTDRDLVKQLGISDEDKGKLFLWITYQCAFSYREGHKNGKDKTKQDVQNFLDQLSL